MLEDKPRKHSASRGWLDFLFDLRDADSTFLRNVGELTTLHGITFKMDTAV
jgi:hypothetical protein